MAALNKTVSFFLAHPRSFVADLDPRDEVMDMAFLRSFFKRMAGRAGNTLPFSNFGCCLGAEPEYSVREMQRSVRCMPRIAATGVTRRPAVVVCFPFTTLA